MARRLGGVTRFAVGHTIEPTGEDRSSRRVNQTRADPATTVGHWLREVTFSHVRQLDGMTEAMLACAWAAGAGFDDGQLVIDVDSAIVEVYGKQGRVRPTATPAAVAPFAGRDPG